MPDPAKTVIMPQRLKEIIEAGLVASHTGRENAALVAEALVRAEIDGKHGHGISRLPSYAAQAKAGKVNGMATPQVSQPKPAVLIIDAAHGFAYPAFAMADQHLPPLTRKTGVGLAAITRSHHFGVAGHHVERLADKGLVALLFGNTPAAMPPHGGRRPLFGTNPIAFAAPIAARPPLVIDLATSTAARGTIMEAARRGEPIPEGWAVDSDGRPTTDPNAALKGALLPMGGAKGAALALMVEVLAAGLTGSAFADEATSFLDAEGGPPNTGQIMLAIDPGLMADSGLMAGPGLMAADMGDAGAMGDGGVMGGRLADFARRIEADGGRLPGSGRIARRAMAAEEGLQVDSAALTAACEIAGMRP